MTYALITEGIVENLIWLYEGNAEEFPSAVPINGRAVQIGDHYAEGVFTRGGAEILTPLEENERIISQLDEMVVELEYQQALLKLELEA